MSILYTWSVDYVNLYIKLLLYAEFSQKYENNTKPVFKIYTQNVFCLYLYILKFICNMLL